jgi:iron(III) transport system permease protein
MTPVILVTLLLSIIASLQSFEVETILGPPFRFFVFSTKVYRLIHQDPPLYASATALSSVILGVLVPLIFLQRWVTGRRQFTTVGGQYRAARVQLRRWRTPAFLLVLLVSLIVTAVPCTFLVLGTFMRLFGFFNMADPWTTENWGHVLSDPIFLTSVGNTLVLTIGTAGIGVLLYTLVAYIAVRTHFAGRGALDLLSWLPSTLPGIILSLGLLWLVLGTPLFRPFYGTMVVLIAAAVVSTLTLGAQTVKSNLVQFGRELEDAARVGGGNWWQVVQHVLLPLLMPVLLLVGTLSFVSAARNVSAMALLATSGTRPMALLQLDYMVEGRYESAAVVGVLVVLLTTGVAIVGRAIGLRFGLRN